MMGFGFIWVGQVLRTVSDRLHLWAALAFSSKFKEKFCSLVIMLYSSY